VTEALTYLYAIGKGAFEVDPRILGVDGQRPARLVCDHGLTAVIGAGQANALGASSREAILRSLLAHERVIESLMGQGELLPVQFGTVVQDETEVNDLLSQGRTTILQALSAVQRKLEFETAITWSVPSVLQAIGAEPAVVQARTAIELRGTVSQDEAVSLGSIVKARLDERRKAIQQKALEQLCPVALQSTAHPLRDDSMVMNTAFLIEDNNADDFQARISGLDALFHGELTLRVIGPLPPYSFFTLEVEKVSREDFASAAGLLGLSGEAFSQAEVKRAYRLMAIEAQRSPSKDGAEDDRREVGRLRRAADILEFCCDETGRVTLPDDSRWRLRIRASAGDDTPADSFGAEVIRGG